MGVRTAVIDLNGWTYADGAAYYYKDGDPYTGWVEDCYVIDGRMCADGVYEVSEGNLHNSYYFDAYGHVVKGKWIYDSAYAQSDGVLAEDEWMTIDGATYYFDGCVKVTGEYWIGTICHYFDADGKYLGANPEKYASGKRDAVWVLVNGDYYYSYEGYYLRSTSPRSTARGSASMPTVGCTPASSSIRTIPTTATAAITATATASPTAR